MAHLTPTHKKSRITLIVSALSVCFAAQSNSQTTTNLVQDPGFESRASLAPYWGSYGNPSASGIDTNAAHAHSGNNSAYLYDDYGSGNFIDIAETVKVAANTTYTLTGYVDASNTTGGIFGVRTPSGTNIGTAALINTDPGPFTHGGSDYQPYTVKFNSGTNTSVVVFAGYTTPGSGSFINLDDVSILSPSGSTPPADPPSSQTIINCNSFSSSGNCGVGGNQNFNPVGPAPSLSGSRILLVPSGTTHQGSAVNYTTKVNVQAFTANFTFVPNGQNVAFVLQNTSDTPGYQGTDFVAGAGCEAGFFQAYGEFPPPNNIFALEFDSWSYLGSVQSFSYSSAQIYQAGQSPCNPNDGGSNYTLIDKVSTSPVALNSPANAQGTSTSDTYSANLTYAGGNLTLKMYNVSAGGACPGANCFTHTWSVDLPSWVGGDTAYVGFTAAPGETSKYPLYIGSFSYTQ